MVIWSDLLTLTNKNWDLNGFNQQQRGFPKKNGMSWFIHSILWVIHGIRWGYRPTIAKLTQITWGCGWVFARHFVWQHPMHQTTNVRKVAGDGCHPISEMNCFICWIHFVEPEGTITMNHVIVGFWLVVVDVVIISLNIHIWIGWQPAFTITLIYNRLVVDLSCASGYARTHGISPESRRRQPAFSNPRGPDPSDGVAASWFLLVSLKKINFSAISRHE